MRGARDVAARDAGGEGCGGWGMRGSRDAGVEAGTWHPAGVLWRRRGNAGGGEAHPSDMAFDTPSHVRRALTQEGSTAAEQGQAVAGVAVIGDGGDWACLGWG